MSYLYSKRNRLEEPHNYMYTQFQGEDFLRSYQSCRMDVLCRRTTVAKADKEPDNMFVYYALPALEKMFYTTSSEGARKFLKLVNGSNAKMAEQSMTDLRFDVLAKGLDEISLVDSVKTLGLLHSLIAVQLINVHDFNTKLWLDRLVQRFEVTKKVYEIYPTGFRKGEGGNTSVRLYWLFALALSLFYASTNEIKYLSTLLKICDLLCSLPDQMIIEDIPQNGLSIVLATEVVSVQLLAEKKGVSYAAI
jgi:hypothetical protein